MGLGAQQSIEATGDPHPAGDQECFARLFESCRPHLLKVCRRTLGAPDGTEDAAHDTYLRAYAGLSQFDGVNLAGWLVRIAQRVCIDRIRAGFRRQPPDGPPIPVATNTEVQLLTAIQIKAILCKLPDRQRQCLKLFYIEGLTAKEVAIATGFTDKQVKACLQNGRRNFQLEWEGLKKRS